MSSGDHFSKLNRKELVKAVSQAAQVSSTFAVFFHTSIAEQFGLSATEEKTLLILSGGSVTAGDIAQQTGLTTASVTSLIDRLESKGFVQRIRDKVDRRRVIVEPNKAKFDELSQVFDSFQGEFDELLTVYSDEQLATIADYLTRTLERSREVIAHLTEGQKKPGNESSDV